MDEKVYVKVPVDFAGVKVIKALKRQGVNVTATAIYGMDQAFIALEAGADCIAPYYNRMETLGVDAANVIGNIAGIINHYGYEAEILAASFKQPRPDRPRHPCGCALRHRSTERPARNLYEENRQRCRSDIR